MPNNTAVPTRPMTCSRSSSGHGIHFCLGAPLARLEGRIVLDALVRRFPDLAPAVDPARLEWIPGPLRGVRRLPVRV